MRLADGTSDEAMKFVVASSAMGSLETLARAEAGDYAVAVTSKPEAH